MTSVELRKIDQSFAGHPVLRQLDLAVEPGEYVVLLGKSGEGKTTALRVIAGLQQPERGDVLIDGVCVNRLPPRRRDVALVFQHDGLYPHLTVGDSIRFPLKGNVDTAQIESRVREAVRITGIEHLMGRFPSQLSGGQLRRAAVAKAIARRTQVRLLDEPLSALDLPVRQSLQNDILNWHQTIPGTTIHVTHDGQEAMRIADRIAVLDRGRIVQFAAPREIDGQPKTLAVANAIASPPFNQFAARIDDGRILFDCDGIKYFGGLDVELPDGDVVVAVRPDGLVPRPDDESATGFGVSFAIVGEVSRLNQLGRHVHVQLAVSRQSVLAVVPSERMPGDVGAGTKIRLVARADDVRLFDAVSGQVLS